jgi:hypothetical protein
VHPYTYAHGDPDAHSAGGYADPRPYTYGDRFANGHGHGATDGNAAADAGGDAGGP